MIRRMALVSAVLLILAGCTGGRPVPAPVAPAPSPLEQASPVVAEPATPPAPEGPCLDKQPVGVFGNVLHRYVAHGTCTTLVDSDSVLVSFRLPDEVSEATARGALVVAGPTEPKVEFFDLWLGQPGNALVLEFPPGQPGERLEVHLAGPLGAGGDQVDLGFAMERAPTARVSVEFRQGGGEWRPLDKKLTMLPRVPTDLRVQVNGQVPLSKVDEELRQNKIPDGEWFDGVTVRTLTEPPGHMVLDLSSIRTADGLSTHHSKCEVFFGAPPQLVALDPVTGAEQLIGEAPLHAYRGSLSPDGRRAVLLAVHQDNPYAEDAWAVDTTTGRLTRLDLQLQPPFIGTFWSGDELVIANPGEVTHWNTRTGEIARVKVPGGDFPVLCGNGRDLIGLTFDISREDKHWLAPVSIVRYDVPTRQAKFIAVDQLKIRIPHAGYIPTLMMECTPDGQGVMIQEPRPMDPPTTRAYHWVRLDLGTETLTEVPDYTPAEAPEWLTGPGAYQVKLEGRYTSVTVRGTGGLPRVWGTGLVIGWRPDGHLVVVRWENAAYLQRSWWGE